VDGKLIDSSKDFRNCGSLRKHFIFKESPFKSLLFSFTLFS